MEAFTTRSGKKVTAAETQEMKSTQKSKSLRHDTEKYMVGHTASTISGAKTTDNKTGAATAV